MRIQSFNKTIRNALQVQSLNNCEVVIDAQNFFYDTYKNSGLQFVFGCESDKYAQYLRNHLSMFKKANVTCYFIFKGGHEYLDSIGKGDHNNGREFVFGGNIVMPIAMKDVYKQVLDEMEFDYTVCKFESKKECIALAETLGCAVMSNDIEFCFYGIPYIPYMTLKFNETTKSIDCQLFSLETFLRIYQLTQDKLSIFIALCDEKLFPGYHTEGFKRIKKIRSHEMLLKWLSKQRSNQTALDIVSKFIPSGFKTNFLEAEIQARGFVRPNVTVGVPSLYLMNRNTFEVTEKDPLWFEKGVAACHIALQYINLYHHGCVLDSWSIQDEDSEDAMLLSMELMTYAYNLMTNYKKSEIKFLIHGTKPRMIKIDDSVQKPNCVSVESVFENGWHEIKSLRLFEHFLDNTLTGFDYKTLEQLPDDVRLLMITLIYFSVKKSKDAGNIVYSMLLSYIALSAIFENVDRNNKKSDIHSIMLTMNKNDILQEDVTTAASVLQEYFNPLSAFDAKKIFDRKMNHDLMELQHCLDNFNFLNKLCESSYKPTIYSKTLNGTFVYKILHEIMTENGGEGLKFVCTKLNPAASVLAFFKGLVKYHTDSIKEMCL